MKAWSLGGLMKQLLSQQKCEVARTHPSQRLAFGNQPSAQGSRSWAEQDHMIGRYLPRNNQLYNLPASQGRASSTESSPKQTAEPPCLALESWPMGLGFRVCIYHFKYSFCPFKNQVLLNKSHLWRLPLSFIEVRDICISISLYIYLSVSVCKVLRRVMKRISTLPFSLRTWNNKCLAKTNKNKQKTKNNWC